MLSKVWIFWQVYENLIRRCEMEIFSGWVEIGSINGSPCGFTNNPKIDRH